LLRGPALPASAAAVARVLHEAGYELEEVPTRPHPDHVRSFERAKPNQLWQTDLFTFVLKRQNRRLYLVCFLDDHSRFITGYGLHASQSAAFVLEVLRAALAGHGTPQEVLTDNGSQYVTGRGKSAFAKELERRGIRQVVAAPRRPQTLGKIERFWGTLWRESVEAAVFLDLDDARRRVTTTSRARPYAAWWRPARRGRRAGSPAPRRPPGSCARRTNGSGSSWPASRP
jgi:transposase InsO family protein